MSMRGGWRRILPAIAITEALAAPDRRPSEKPADTGLVERSEVSLILLDVDVTDKLGRPVRGLKKEDFVVRLNGLTRKVVSVDDLCPCDDAPEIAKATAPAERAPMPPSEASVRYVLYFDFGQLRPDGRALAVKEVSPRCSMRS